MDREQWLRRLLATFVVELSENVGLLRRHLATLRDAGPGESGPLLQAISRVFHTLKGAARAVQLVAIERVCHHVEHRLADAREGCPDMALLTLLRESTDALAEAAGRLGAGPCLRGAAVEVLWHHLDPARGDAESATPIRTAPESIVREGGGEKAASTPLLSSGGSTAAKRRILVADDSDTARDLVVAVLEAAGYAVEQARDGLAAWHLLQERGADLLVTDVDMPHLDGFTLTEIIRGCDRFQRLPIVLVTARTSEEDRARGIGAGADAYLIKSGFDQMGLVTTVTQLL